MKSVDAMKEPLKSILNEYLQSLNKYSYYDAEGKLKTEDFLKDKIQPSLDTGKLILCIGAGVTVKVVGTWRELLNKILLMRCYSAMPEASGQLKQQLADNKDEWERKKTPITSIEIPTHEELEEYIRSLRKPFIADSTNVLELGEYLMFDENDHSQYIGTDSENSYRELFFAAQVRHAIITSVQDKLRGKTLEDYFLNDIPDKDTLKAVVELCLKKKIRHIVTYNFDMVLDRLLHCEKIRQKYSAQPEHRIIIRDFTSLKPRQILKRCNETVDCVDCGKCDRGEATVNEITIYHVHGIADSEIEEVTPIIFSENSYQTYQNNPLNWSNLKLADLMSENDTLCIGFSGDDTNFRTLRHFLAGNNQNPFFANDAHPDRTEVFILRNYKETIENLTTSKSVSPEKDAVNAMTCVKIYLSLVNSYFRKQLDTNIIWSDGFDEMAEQIQSLCK